MTDLVIEDIWGHAERRSNDTYALSCRSTIGDNGTVNNSSGYETDDVSDSEEYHFEYAITTGSDADSVEIPGAYAITPVSFLMAWTRVVILPLVLFLQT